VHQGLAARVLPGVLLLLATSSGPACSSSESVRTGVELTVTYGSGIDAVTVLATREMDELARVTRPEEGQELGADGELIVIGFDEGLDGQTIGLRVDGLAWGEVVLTRRAEVTIAARRMVPVSVHLGPQPGCGDGLVDGAAGEACDDGDVDPADGCSAACEV